MLQLINFDKKAADVYSGLQGKTEYSDRLARS